MIRVIRAGVSPESESAERIASMAGRAWPWLEEDPESFLWVVPSVQCHGQLPRDVDVVLLGYFAPDRANYFRASAPLTVLGGTHVEPDRVRVDSLCLTIEVKDHDPSGVRFSGSRVEVMYSSGWHDASDQSFRQLYSFKNYLEACNAKYIPRITNLVWLRNLPPHELPPPPHNILHGNATWNGLLNQAASTSQLIRAGDEYIFTALNRTSYESGPKVFDDIVDAIAIKLEPSGLDRAKMDAISKDVLDSKAYAMAGDRMLLFKGHGGTGKTMLLLQVARKASSEGRSTLLLTYNKALVADIRRLMALAGISDEFGLGSIQVMTVQSFFYRLLIKNDLIKGGEEDFLEDYLLYLELLAENAPAAGIKSLEVDLVLIDEGQDWPDIERQLLVDVYGPEKLVVADGLQQLVRGQLPCNWKKGLGNDFYAEVPLSKGFRMKRNIAAFSNRMAEAFGLDGWHVDEQGDAYGGHVIVVEGSYFNAASLHEKILSESESAGNSPVDILACVPPMHGAGGFAKLNQEIWDGTTPAGRRGYPTSLKQLRVVQYESCRGLEGWAAINLGFDEFLRIKIDGWGAQADGEPGDFVDDSSAARRFAARWAMIALTRAIDTIVIEVSDCGSEAKELLRNLYDGPCRDFIEWINA